MFYLALQESGYKETSKGEEEERKNNIPTLHNYFS